LGKGLLLTAPKLMKFLSVVGTAAMFLVGGGILAHGIPFMHNLEHSVQHHYGSLIAGVGGSLANMILGIIAGAVVLLVVTGISKVFAKTLSKKL
jgi:predicted DNA repair protein MutK